MTPSTLPFDPEALAATAARGGGEAAHRLAVMSAMGFGLPHDWATALDRLSEAAALGFRPALEQMALLKEIAGGEPIDIRSWLGPPRPRTLGAAPAILAIDGFLPVAACDFLIARAQGGLAPALVYDPVSGGGRRESARTNTSIAFELNGMDVVLALVRERIARAAGLPVKGLEWTQVLHYEPGQTFDWHHDWLDPALPGHALDLAARGQRIATCLIYLNDDFEGGETAFEAGGLRHRGRKGDALMWANTLPDGAIDMSTRHAGLPPTVGRKWVLSQWLRGRAPTA